ncbi:MAG: outer membrane beta-barrel protein [Usitatibacter sp.]
MQMKFRMVFGVLAAALCTHVAAEDKDKSDARDGLTMPYQPAFWRYVAAAAGRSAYDLDCVPGTSIPCNEKDGAAFKIAAGGKFNNTLGVEIGYVNLGDVDITDAVGHGHTRAQGANLSVVGSARVFDGVAINAKLGTVYGWTRSQVRAVNNSCVLGTVPESVCKHTEDGRGFGLSYGAGVSAGIGPHLQLRLDWDRYRFRFAPSDAFHLNGGERDIDFWSVGFNVLF